MRLVLIFYFGMVTQFLQAQVFIAGKITDTKGRPVPGASVSIRNSYDGATSDSSGNYRFSTSEKGQILLVITSVGYREVEIPVNIQGHDLRQDLTLKEALSELKAVTISAGSFSAGDAKRGAVLSSLDIATTAGSNADISAALKTLPGTSQVGEQEGLFVRGGAGYETKQYIDGTLVNNPYYTSVPNIAQRGRFSPFLFKGTVFSTGGYSAEYGQALSSVVLLESLDLPEKSEVDASISPIVIGVGTQQLAADKRSSWGFSCNYVNAGLYFALVKQVPQYFGTPQYLNGDANFRIKTKRGGMVKYYTTFAYNSLGVRQQDVDSLNMNDAFSLTTHNWYNNLSWKEYLANGWKMNLGASFSTNVDNISQQVQLANNQPAFFSDSVFWMQAKNFALVSTQNLTQGKAVMEKKLGGLSVLRFGGEFWHAYYKEPFSQLYLDTVFKYTDNFAGLFAESDIYVTNELAAKVGLRYEHSSILKQSDLAPRISLAYKTGKDAQVSVAYGIFYQEPQYSQIYYAPALHFSKATHYILNYQKMSKDRMFRVEAYYKTYQYLVKNVPINQVFSTYNNSGDGYAGGLDLFWRDKKTFKNFDYWISYSYLDTKRNYLNYTEQLMPNFAATHTASVVLKRFFTESKFGVNLTYSFATGRPYYDIRLNDSYDGYYLAHQGKTVDYSSLNFSAEYIPTAGNARSKNTVVWFASITNVLGYNAVYGYNFSYSGLYQQPITPPAKRFYFIGCFLSWGVDRSQDAINNNL